MSRSNFSNCKNPDAVVQCAVRIDRASRAEWLEARTWPEGSRGTNAALVACSCCERARKGERDRKRVRERILESDAAVMDSDADTKTPAPTSQSSQVPVRRKSNTQAQFAWLHVPMPQRTAIQRANDSLTRDIFGWQKTSTWTSGSWSLASVGNVLAITSQDQSNGWAWDWGERLRRPRQSSNVAKTLSNAGKWRADGHLDRRTDADAKS